MGDCLETRIITVVVGCLATTTITTTQAGYLETTTTTLLAFLAVTTRVVEICLGTIVAAVAVFSIREATIRMVLILEAIIQTRQRSLQPRSTLPQMTTRIRSNGKWIKASRINQHKPRL